MMLHVDYLKIYRKIFRQSFIVTPEENDGEYAVSLIENDSNAKLKQLNVHNVPKNTILLPLHQYSKLDLGKLLGKILEGGSGIFKCCDYLMITAMQEGIHLIFVEMKSNELDRGDVVKQFKGASCFIDYCNAIAEHFHNAPLQNAAPLHTWYVLFSLGNINKRPTKREYNAKHTSPDNYLHHRIGSKTADIQFGMLLTPKRKS